MFVGKLYLSFVTIKTLFIQHYNKKSICYTFNNFTLQYKIYMSLVCTLCGCLILKKMHAPPSRPKKNLFLLLSHQKKSIFFLLFGRLLGNFFLGTVRIFENKNNMFSNVRLPQERHTVRRTDGHHNHKH